MAKKLGYFVTGSDEDAYPPMNKRLTSAKIPWANSHSAKNLTRWGRPDLVIQGNQIRRGNPELNAARRLKIPIVSDSEYFYKLTKNRRRWVVAGSHGKTTTSALVAWILQCAGRSPGFRLGTLPKNFETTVELGKGCDFVYEGDEYTTGYNDRRPKFFYFHPQIAIINNIEWDHPDVFKSPDQYRKAFQKYLVDNLPKSGLLVINADDPNTCRAANRAHCRLVTFGLDKGDYRAENIKFDAVKTSFDVLHNNRLLVSLETPMVGYHNVRNCLAALAACHSKKISLQAIKKALRSFGGISRRFEVVGEPRGITVIDDYAHHPTKVRETIAAARLRFPEARIFVVYVPHTYSRTKALEADYVHAFDLADTVVIPDIEPARERHLSALINSRDLVKLIKKSQKNVFYIPERSEIIDFVTKRAGPGDVILCMSVRGFDDLAAAIVEKLKSAPRRV